MIKFKIVSNKVEGGTTPAMMEAVQEKLGFIESTDDVRITVEPYENHVKTSISFVDEYTHHYRLSTEGETFYSSLDILKDMVKRATRKYHEKTRKIQRVAEDLHDDAPLIAKEKIIVISDQSVEDAIEEMEELGHDWFLFRNEDTGEASLVYRRFDNNYGLVVIK